MWNVLHCDSALACLFVLVQVKLGIQDADSAHPEYALHEHDGTLGLVPETFDEEDDALVNLFAHPSVRSFLSICSNRSTGDPDVCENCPAIFRNSKNLLESDGKCDALAQYNFKKLRHQQRKLFNKQDLSSDFRTRILFISLYGVCILLGVYLLIMRQFRIVTLWDKFAEDPTQGMRSFRYERMKFKFDYDDPGADPDLGDETIESSGFKDWELYNSSDDDDVSGPSGSGDMKKKRDNRRPPETGPSEWPWEVEGYDFTTIKYKEGLKKDIEDWEQDEGSNFNSNI